MCAPCRAKLTTSGDRLVTEIVRLPLGEDPRAAFDSLAAGILLVSGTPPGEGPGVVAQTTRSLEAYRAYLAGAAALQRFALDSAEAYLSRAVRLDSTFALAYLRLLDVEGWAAYGVGITAGRAAQRPLAGLLAFAYAYRLGLRPGGDPQKRLSLLTMVEAHGERLTPRLKATVQFTGAYERGRFQQARTIAEAWLRGHPTDPEMWYAVGETHRHEPGGNSGKALRAFQRALAVDSSFTLAYGHTLDELTSCNDAPPLRNPIGLAGESGGHVPLYKSTHVGRCLATIDSASM